MRVSELRELVNVRRPQPPYGTRRLARAYSIEDLRRLARRRIPSGAFAYIEGGGDDEVTMRRNRAAFEDYELLPRVLRDVSEIDLRTSVLGTPLALPFALAPIGSPRLFHHDGELATARAAKRAGIAFSLSSSATGPCCSPWTPRSGPNGNGSCVPGSCSPTRPCACRPSWRAPCTPTGGGTS